MLSENYRWNAFLVVRNEQDHIQDVINSIKAQDPLPPSRILVINDESTDNTKNILDSITDIEVTHYSPLPPHTRDQMFRRVSKLRGNLFKEAINDADYVVCVDGDTVIPNQYISEITKRMRRDGIVIACGQDPNNKLTLVAESPVVVDVQWLKKFQCPTRTDRMNGSILGIHASLTGFGSAVYTDIHIEYKRKVGANYNKLQVRQHGKAFKRDGFSLWYVFLLAVKRRRPHYISGYLFSKVEGRDHEIASWNKRYQMESVFGRLGMKCSLLRKTDTAIYVEPAKASVEF